jgi:hypothetical protein
VNADGLKRRAAIVVSDRSEMSNKLEVVCGGVEDVSGSEKFVGQFAKNCGVEYQRFVLFRLSVLLRSYLSREDELTSDISMTMLRFAGLETKQDRLLY